jgi:hypothetical protein
MKLQAFSKTFGYLMIVAVLILAVGLAWSLPDQLKARQQVTAMKAMFPNSVQQALICTNCARLSVNICSIPGYGCAHCDDFYEYLGVVVLASEGVTLTLDYSDAVATRHKARKVTKCPDK